MVNSMGFELTRLTPESTPALQLMNSLQHFNIDRPVKRFELAVILAYYNQPFNKTAIDIKGKIKQAE